MMWRTCGTLPTAQSCTSWRVCKGVFLIEKGCGACIRQYGLQHTFGPIECIHPLSVFLTSLNCLESFLTPCVSAAHLDCIDVSVRGSNSGDEESTLALYEHGHKDASWC